MITGGTSGRKGIATNLEGMARAAVGLGQPEPAARLLGAAAGRREAYGLPMLPFEQADHDAAVARARRERGEERFAALWGEGEAMPLGEAVALAGALAGPSAP